MKKSLIKHGLCFLLLLFGFLTRATAQSILLVVTMNDGTEQVFHMSETDRMYFEDNTKLVIEEGTTKTPVIIPLADIRKITCNETEGAEENNEPSATLYPNPVHDMLTLRNLHNPQHISIYATDGRLVKSVIASSEQPINVSDLPAGLYLIKTQTQTLKMIKL